jgi:hypothetical protein
MRGSGQQEKRCDGSESETAERPSGDGKEQQDAEASEQRRGKPRMRPATRQSTSRRHLQQPDDAQRGHDREEGQNRQPALDLEAVGDDGWQWPHEQHHHHEPEELRLQAPVHLPEAERQEHGDRCQQVPHLPCRKPRIAVARGEQAFGVVRVPPGIQPCRDAMRAQYTG